MSVTQQTDEIVDEYLKDLNFAVRFCGVRARARFVNEIKEHIVEGRSRINPNDDVALRALLQRIGRPEALADELIESQRLSQRNPFRRSIERNGPRRLIVQIVLTPVVVVVVILLLLAHSYQPLDVNGGGAGGNEVIAANDVVARTVPDNAPSFLDVPTVWIQPNGHFKIKVLLDLYNESSKAISITGVGPLQFGYPTPRTSVQFDSRVNYLGGAKFYPFSLRARSDQVLLVTLSDVCQPQAGEELGLTYVPVTYSFFGFSHSVNIAITPFWLQRTTRC